MTVGQLRNLLYIGSLLYLVVPYLVFFGGWIRQPYATLLSVLLVLGILVSIGVARRYASAGDWSDARISPGSLALFLLPVVIIGLIIGAGGWGYQFGDWPKHNAILRDLVTEPWPVVYEIGGEQLLLTYYTAYQLPAALAGKLFGWNVANHVLFGYTLFGLLLAALWIRLFTEIRWWWLFILFAGFSGMDIVGQVLMSVQQEPSIADAADKLGERIRTFYHLEWWSGFGFAQYSSMAALMVLVPNQAIAGWMLTAMALSDTRSGQLKKSALLYLSLCALWTPFVGLGLLPLILFLLIYEWKKDGFAPHLLRNVASLPNIAGIATGLVVAVYLAGRFQEYVMPIDMSGIVYDEKITLTFLRIPYLFIERYLAFVVLEFALLHVLLYWYLHLQKEPLYRRMRGLLIFSSIFLLLLPLLNWGWNNEPSMRSSIPTLFITVLITLRVLADPARSATALWVKKAMIGILLVGSLNAVHELGREVYHIAERGQLVAIPDMNGIDSIFDIQEKDYRQYHNFVGQYVGSADSWYVRYLAKP